MSDRTSRWLDALIERHTHGLTSVEFLKAVRALSARYVERRSELSRRSPTDSPGKRAAFAGFYAPLHFLTTQTVVQALGAEALAPRRIIDLGCGTGAASAAWALASPETSDVRGIDRDGWALAEAMWNWKQLGVHGRTRRGDLVAATCSLVRNRRQGLDRTGLLLAWSVNELPPLPREDLRRALLEAATRGSQVLVLEPIARASVPWWGAWAEAWRASGGRADEWKFDLELPPALARLRADAGFGAEPIGTRSLWLPGRRSARATIE